MEAGSRLSGKSSGGSGAPETPDSGSSLPPSAYDPFYSGEITTLGPPLPEAPDSPPIPVIRDGRKIFEIIIITIDIDESITFFKTLVR